MSAVKTSDTNPVTNGLDYITSSIPTVPITEKHRAFVPKDDSHLGYPGTARANIASSTEAPKGTTDDNYAALHSHQTVLQQHCDFFDANHDGIIWPFDTYIGFRKIGFGIFLSLLSTAIIHLNFSYPTSPSWIPDPFLRIYIQNIHRDKHGSDTGTYDNEGRFVPQKFEEIFSKYADGRDYLTAWDMVNIVKGQRCIADPIGWGGAIFEWIATYIMFWPEDGRITKDDIRAVYDGSMFHKIAAKRSEKRR